MKAKIGAIMEKFIPVTPNLDFVLLLFSCLYLIGKFILFSCGMRCFFVAYVKENIKKTLSTICVKDTKYNLCKNVM